MEEKIIEEKVKTAGSTKSFADGYSETMQALKQAESALPEYSTSYDDEISELFGQIMNRKSFSYSTAADPLYGAYRDRYIREGALAMRDSMGQAASLTGGYGSSYGQAVGQQQYEAYLQKLNDVIPELYSAAYKRYSDEGDALMQKYSMAQDAAAAEYGRHRDNTADAKFGMEMQVRLEEQNYKNQQEYYTRLYTLMSKGYSPSAEEIARAGMSAEQAAFLKKKFAPATVSYGGEDYSGGSGKKTAGSKESTKLTANAPGASDTNKSRR